MAKIVSVHSFRGGTGKSNLVANLAATIALQGQRVGIIDTDIQSPGIHVLFGLDETQIDYTLNDYLWDRLSGLSEESLSVLFGASIFGREFLAAEVAIVSALEPAHVVRSLEEARGIEAVEPSSVCSCMTIILLVIDHITKFEPPCF